MSEQNKIQRIPFMFNNVKELRVVIESDIRSVSTYYENLMLSKKCDGDTVCNCGLIICSAVRVTMIKSTLTLLDYHIDNPYLTIADNDIDLVYPRKLIQAIAIFLI